MISKQKDYNIQLFRALAIMAVVLIHTCPSGEWQVICRPFINFSVATFLFLSGYLTNTDNDNWEKFFKKRIVRVIIPYIIWTILYSVASKAWTPKALALNLLTAKSAATMYYIFVYIQFVMLTPLLGRLAKSKYQWMGWLVAPLSVMIFKYYPLLMGFEYPSIIKILWGDSCLGWFTYYYLGLLLGNRILVRDYKMSHLLICYGIAIVLNMAEGYWWLQLGENNCGTQIKLSSFLTSSIFLLIIYTYLKTTKKVDINKSLKLIGDYSFGIYLSHIMFMRILAYVPYYNSLPYVVNSAIVLAISFGFDYIGNKILGSPINKWLGFK